MKNIEIINKMTLIEKCSMLAGKDFWQTMDYPQYGVPSMFLADGPTGVRKQRAAADHLGLNPSYPATCFPTSATIANSWDKDIAYNVGQALGSEARDLGVNVLLGPGINVKRDALCGRNFEYFSEDPYLAGKMSANCIKGLQSNGISACVKHFAVNSQEYKRMVIDAVLDERTLREIYLTAFEIAVKEGKTKSIMSSYNSVNGQFTNENQHLLVDILRKEWGFNGVVVTDWGGENDRIAGIKAGNELEMPGGHKDTIDELVKAVEDGVITEELINENVDRLLTLIFDTDKSRYPEIREITDANQDVALNSARSSIVLLENHNNILPLDNSAKVAVVGDFAFDARYQGAGSSVVNATKIVNFVDVAASSLNVVGSHRGYKRMGKASNAMLKQSVKLANSADCVIYFMGLHEDAEVEGLDRQNTKLPANQLKLLNALIATGKKIIVVLSCGSSVEIDFADKVDAIVHGYLLGQTTGQAILDIIDGTVNPSGKLSESYPISYLDGSTANYFPGLEKTVEHREGMFVGYRYYDTAGVAVRYPFGYGLSYTQFDYSNLVVTDKGVTFDITNSGNRDGQEVAQLYVSLPNSNVVRPLKELKGFAKVGLAKGETKSVSIDFDDKTFRFFNTDINGWDIEEGNYTIMIGKSCQDIVLTDSLHVAGSVVADKVSALPSYATANVKAVSDEEFAKLLGHAIPQKGLTFIKKNRIIVDANTTVLDLKYARGFAGRLFAGGVKFGYNFCMAFGMKGLAITLKMFTFNLPMRGLSRMTGGAISWAQLEGMMTMFNGKFFKGLGMFFKAGKEAKKKEKLAKKLANNNK